MMLKSYFQSICNVEEWETSPTVSCNWHLIMVLFPNGFTGNASFPEDDLTYLHPDYCNVMLPGWEGWLSTTKNILEWVPFKSRSPILVVSTLLFSIMIFPFVVGQPPTRWEKWLKTLASQSLLRSPSRLSVARQNVSRFVGAVYNLN